MVREGAYPTEKAGPRLLTLLLTVLFHSLHPTGTRAQVKIDSFNGYDSNRL
jgi:hypothetical protein